MTLVVFRFGALGPQKIQCAAARAFNLQRLINAGAQFFAAGAAADFLHASLSSSSAVVSPDSFSVCVSCVVIQLTASISALKPVTLIGFSGTNSGRPIASVSDSVALPRCRRCCSASAASWASC